VDIRHRAPPVCAVLAAAVPPGELWLLGGPEVGHCRLRVTGEAVDGSTFAAVPEQVSASVELPADCELPPEIPVRLVKAPPGRGKPDALLLDEKELAWAQSLLLAQP